MKFRYDINAIRAVAVLSVVIYHFYPDLLTGGFVGVDVFFVISGYLMTSIIANNVETDSFSLHKFYAARLRRIVPALAFMCAMVLLFGYFYLLPEKFELLGRHIRDSITFISNLTYEKEAGYFDQESTSKWVLHTWSLSVEWQFYLVFPLVILLFSKVKRFASTAYCLIGIALASFVWCLYVANSQVGSPYFSLLTRAWELLLGSFAYYFGMSSYRKTASAIGWLAIIVSPLVIDSSLVWPNYYSVVPTVGTLLVIMANTSNPLVRNNTIQLLGKWSYSIYLWHWPVHVLFNQLNLHGSWILLAIAISIVLGMFSYYLIEPLGKKNNATIFILISMLSIYGYASYVRSSDGAPTRMSLSAELRETYNNIQENPRRDCRKRAPSDSCRYFSDDPSWAVFGDSHAAEMAYSLGRKLSANDDGVIDYSKSACQLTLNPKNRLYNEECAGWRLDAIERINNNDSIENVVLINRYNLALYGKNETSYPRLPNGYNDAHRELVVDDIYHVANAFVENGKTVWLISGVPEMGRDIHELVGEKYMKNQPLETIIANSIEYQNERNHYIFEKLELFSNQHEQINFIDITDVFCDDSSCYAVRDGIPLYSDDDHMSLLGADRVSDLLIGQLSK